MLQYQWSIQDFTKEVLNNLCAKRTRKFAIMPTFIDHAHQFCPLLGVHYYESPMLSGKQLATDELL